jgi:hypothetical protein
MWFYREVLGLYVLLYALNLDKVTRMNSVSVLRTLTQTLFILVFGLAFHHQFKLQMVLNHSIVIFQTSLIRHIQHFMCSGMSS